MEGQRTCSGEQRPIGSERTTEVRFLTYLSPGIPQAFFDAVAEHVGRELGIKVVLSTETRISGPVRGTGDLFSTGDSDVGFVCAPSYFWLHEQKRPPVELAGAAPVFRDGRAPGRPVYFSEVVVRRESPVRHFREVRGGSWAYNDPCPLSGYYNLLKKLAEGEKDNCFEQLHHSGSHLESIKMVASGVVDAAAIDSNVLRIALRSAPELRERLRVLESWGPYPIQPVVLRSSLHPNLKDHLRAALLAIDASTSPVLADFGLESFGPVTHKDYASEEQALRECEGMTGPDVKAKEPLRNLLAEVAGLY